MSVTALIAAPTACSSSSPASDTKNGDVTWDSLAAARDKIAAGGDVIDLDSDGSVQYRHTNDAPSGTDTEELLVRGKVVVRWTHTGVRSHIDQDTDADGTFDWKLDAVGGPAPTDRSIVITSGASPTSGPVRRETFTQTSDTIAHVTIEAAAGQGWLVVETYDTTVFQGNGATGITTAGCSAAEDALLTPNTALAVNGGLACLKHFNVTDIYEKLVIIMAKRGIHFDCGTSLPGTCAQASVFSTLTAGAFSSEVSIDTASGLGGAGCENVPAVLFHELLHITTGASHASGLDTSTPAGRSKDRIYSCTDICFNPYAATQCECATCLITTRNDPLCAAFTPCGAFHVVLTFTEVGTLIVCGAAPADVTDRVEFTMTATAAGAFTIDDIVNSKSTFPAPTIVGGTIMMVSDPEALTLVSGTGRKQGNIVSASLVGTTTQGSCNFVVGGASSPYPGFGTMPSEDVLTFDATMFKGGTLTTMSGSGWTVTVTE